MFAEYSYACFSEHPKQETKQSVVCLSFPVKVVERLLHGFPKLVPESPRVECKEFPVQSTCCLWFIHDKSTGKWLSWLIAVWDTELRLDQVGLRLFQALVFPVDRFSTTGSLAR